MLSKEKRNTKKKKSLSVPVQPVLVVQLAEVLMAFVLKLGHTVLYGRHCSGQQLTGCQRFQVQTPLTIVLMNHVVDANSGLTVGHVHTTT